MKQKDEVPSPWSHSARRWQSWDRDPGSLSAKAWAPSLWLSHICLGRPASWSHEPGKGQRINRTCRPSKHDHIISFWSPNPQKEGGRISQMDSHFCCLLAPHTLCLPGPPTSPSLPRIRGHRYTETKAPSSHLPTQIPISDGCMSLCLTTAGQQGQTHSAKHTSEHLQSTSRVPGPGRRGQGYVPSQSRGATHQGSTWAWRRPPSLPTQSVFAAQPLAAQPTRTRTAHTRGRTFRKVTH